MDLRQQFEKDEEITFENIFTSESNMKKYIFWLESKVTKLNIDDVSNQRELLKAYEQANNPCDCDSCKESANDRIEKYLSL